MTRPLDPRRLLIFRTVVRAGSLGAAARDLGWTQPAVSQHVRALERQVGVPLVVRGPRGITATDAGRRLLEHADGLAARLRAAEEELGALVDARAGTVRLATFPTAGAALVPAALVALGRDHPGVEVRLTAAEPPEAAAQVIAGEVDAALVFRYEDDPDQLDPALTRRPLTVEEMCLVLPPQHPLARRRTPLRLADAAGERWVAGCLRCREHLVRACARVGFAPDVRHSTDDYVLVQALVAQGLAVALLPRTALDVAPRPDVAVRAVAGGGRRRVDLVHHQDAAGGPALQALVAALVAALVEALPAAAAGGSTAGGSPAGRPAGRPPG